MDRQTRILLVDDNPEMLEVLTPALEQNGYEVLEARTGQQCLDLARTKEPDLILLDVVLPDINGREVCRRIKADLPGKTFVVLISGHATLPEDTVQGFQCGADEYIARPIQIWELLARIGSMVRIQQGQEALRESEDRWHSLVQNAPDYIFTLDNAWRIRFINRPLHSLTVDQMVGEPLQRYVPAEYQGRVSHALREVQAKGHSVSYETPFRVGKEEHWYSHHAGLVRQAGQAPLLMVIAADISDRKKTEQNIQQYADIVQNMQVGLYVWQLNDPRDLAGFTLLAANPAATTLTRVRTEEILGKRMVDSFPQLLQTTLPERFAQVIDSGIAQDLGEIQYGDERVPSGVFAVRAFPLPNRCVGMVFENITQRHQAEIEIKQLNQTLEARVVERTAQLEKANAALLLEIAGHRKAEEALRESDRRFASFMSNTSAIAWMKDEDLRYVYINPAWQGMFKVSLREVLGKTDFELWTSETASELRVNDEIVRRSGKTLETYETIRTHDKKLRYFWVFKFPFDAGGKRLIGGMAIDITERMLAENALRGLPKRILEAEEAERRRVSRELHDSVNQLLTSVKFRIQSVEEKMSGAPRQWTTDILKAKALLGRAVQEVRRISHNLRPSELDDLGLIPAVRQTIHDFKERTGILVTFRSANLPSRFSPAVELALYRIIQEALSNVGKHSGAEKVAISIGMEGTLVKLSIRDNGKGFPLVKVKGKRAKKAGFGLVNMRERAAFIGGQLTMDSGRGKGTRIRVVVPWEQEDRSQEGRDDE